MKTRFAPVLALAASLVLVTSGCGQKDTAPAAAAPASAAATVAPAAKVVAPAPAPAAPREVEITANDQMKFSVTAIEAKVGEEIKVTLTNVGSMPKEAMGHNWVLLKPGTDLNAFAAAAMTAKDTDYVPAALKDQVVASIGLLGPRKSGEVTVKLTVPGEYPFICSFPAHFMVGMKGVLTVK